MDFKKCIFVSSPSKTPHHLSFKYPLPQEKANEKVQDIVNKEVSGAVERLQNITVRTTPEKQN